MLTTANPAGTRNDAPANEAEETRPVRLLVPTKRRTDYWLSLEDTLRASDLGITRDTTNRALTKLIGETDAHPDHTLAQLRKLRDALRHPRDIAEARAWGYIVPGGEEPMDVGHEENSEEFNPDPRKRLGWWWVYDPTRTETRAQREARYLADERLIDMKGAARVLCRAYITVKDLKFESDNIRLVLEDPDYLDGLARTIAEQNPRVTVAQAKEQLVAKAREDILKATPPRRDRAGQSDLWYVCDWVKNGRTSTRLDEWYEFNKIKQTGRPKGAKTRRRRSTAQ